MMKVMSAMEGGSFSYQGVDYEFIDETKKHLEDLVCPICQEVLSDPLITSCGHLFCRMCLERHESGPKDCPVCRQEYTAMSDQFHTRRIGGLKVKCSNARRGCKWSGELKDAKGHVAASSGPSCQYTDVLCTNGCGEYIQRRLIADHETNQCPKRPYTCNHCGKKGTCDDIESSHYTVCTLLPVPCPTGCSTQVPRSQLLLHLGECYRRPVKCKYRQIGCPAVLEAKDMEQHLETQKDRHLELSMDAVVKLTTCVSQLQLLPDLAQQQAGSAMPFSRPWLESPSALPFPPWIFKLEGYEEKRANSTAWCSEPFFTHPGGYKMCLQVYANGFKCEEGHHLSAFTCLLRGEMDQFLKWPFRGKLFVCLLNQVEDDNHIPFSPFYRDDAPDEVAARVLPPKNISGGRGKPKVVELSALADPANPSVKYLVDNCLYFKIKAAEVDA